MSAEARIRERLADGDLGAAATVALREYGPQILRYLRAALRDESWAEDAFASVAENVWKGIGAYRGDSTFRTWALRIAHNVANSQRTERWRRRVRRLATNEASRLAAEIRRTSALVDAQRKQQLETLRGSLTHDEQRLLVLRVDQELTWDEIAYVLSDAEARATPDALMKRFERLRERLTSLARERGFLE